MKIGNRASRARETPRFRRLPMDAALAGVSGVVTVGLLAGEVEPAAGRTPRLVETPVVSMLPAVAVVVSLAVFAMGEAWLLRRGSGRRRTILWVPVGGAVVALAASGGMGAIAVALTAAALVLIALHQAMGKFVPALGTMALIAVVGLVWTLANPRMLYPWPVLLAMTHVGICRVVTHSLGTSRPRLSARGVVMVLVMLGLLSLALVAVHAARMGNVPAGAWAAMGSMRHHAWVGPALAALGMAIGGVAYVVWTGRRGPPVGRRPHRDTMTGRRAGSASAAMQWRGLLLYDAGWLAATTPWAAVLPATLLALSLVWRWRHPARAGSA